MIQINIHYKLNELTLIVLTYIMKEEMRQSNGFVLNYRFLKEFTFYMTYDRISNIALFSSTGSIKMNLKRFNSMLNGWIFVSNLNTRCQIRYIQSIHHRVENPPLCFMDTIALVLDCFFLTYQTSDIKDATELIVKISLISLIRSVLRSLYIPETLTFFIDCSLKNVIGYGV